MRSRKTFTIAITLSSLLLALLTGAAIATTGLATSWMPAAELAAVPAQDAEHTPVQEGQITVSQADELVRQRAAGYQAQLDELTLRLQKGQERISGLASQEQVLSEQLAQLQQARQERAASYAGQLTALQEQYGQRAAQYAAQLQEIQARIAEANALLGK